MKRLTIFAHYDKDNIIDDYVIYWLKYMNKLSDIILVSNNNLPIEEYKKVEKLVLKHFIGSHGGKGEKSIKIAYEYAYKNHVLEQYDWLIIIGDSIYGPFFDIEPYMIEKEKKEDICYGFTKAMVNTENEHIQSTFLAMPKKAFLSKEIYEHLINLDKLGNKSDAVVYGEIKWSQILRNLGFKLEGMFDDIDPNYIKYEPVKPAFVEMIEKGYPFVRKTLFTKNYLLIENIKDYLKLKNIIPKECFDNMQKNIDRTISKDILYINMEYPEIRKNIEKKQNILDQKYREEYNYPLEFLEVQTFIEKLIFLKLNYQTEKILKYSDKYIVREYLKDKIDNQLLMPLLGLYNNEIEILSNLDLDKLDENTLLCSTINDTKIYFNKNINYIQLLHLINFESSKYFNSLEWQYKYIKPRLLTYKDEYHIYDQGILYKIFCFNSKPSVIKVISKQNNNTYANFYNLEWDKLDIIQEFTNIEYIEKPPYLKEMINIAEKLSNEFPIFVSVDFIGNNEKFYFDKFDFYSEELLHPINNKKYDLEWGNYIKIPNIQNEYLTLDKDIYLRTLIKYDILSLQLMEYKKELFSIRKVVDKIAWWIPFKSWRIKFRDKLYKSKN